MVACSLPTVNVSGAGVASETVVRSTGASGGSFFSSDVLLDEVWHQAGDLFPHLCQLQFILQLFDFELKSFALPPLGRRGLRWSAYRARLEARPSPASSTSVRSR